MKRTTKYEKLPHKAKESLETLGTMGISESLSELYLWEAEGFGNYQISELISLLLDTQKELRKQHVPFV